PASERRASRAERPSTRFRPPFRGLRAPTLAWRPRAAARGDCPRLTAKLYLSRVAAMASRRALSPQTICVLAALCAEPSVWRHGYTLAKQTGLKSGTLYPILMRLADPGLVEASWEAEHVPGR